ncbi:hypothetical protein Tco_0809162 [Tanacetum coccineum]
MLRKCHGHGLTKGAIIQIFYHGLDEPIQGILDETAGEIFLYKSPNQAFQILEDKVLFELDWFTKSQNEHHQKYVSFADESDSNSDNSRLMEKLEELNNDVRNDLEDFKRRIRSMRTVHWKLFARDDGKTTGVLPKKKSKPINQEPQSKTDFEKLRTKFLDGQRVTNMFVKNNWKGENFDEWEKSQNISSEQTDRTEPPPPPQAHTEQVNAVFTESGKSDDSLKIQTLPPIIVEDKPIKTSKRGYHVVKTKEYHFPLNKTGGAWSGG